MLVENRPYSAANGFAMTSTESTACVGKSRSKSPVDGSIRLALLICSAPWVGCPPLMRNRPFPSRTTPGNSGNRLRKSSPSSGAVSNSDPDSMSLIDTGWTLSVGDGVSARTWTPGRTNVNCASRITCAVSFARTTNTVESRSTKPGPDAVMR